MTYILYFHFFSFFYHANFFNYIAVYTFYYNFESSSLFLGSSFLLNINFCLIFLFATYILDFVVNDSSVCKWLKEPREIFGTIPKNKCLKNYFRWSTGGDDEDYKKHRCILSSALTDCNLKLSSILVNRLNLKNAD